MHDRRDDSSADLLRRRQQVAAPVMRGSSGRERAVISRAAGSHVWDAEGRRLLDLSGSTVTVAVGHCHPRIVARVQHQAELMMHCPTGRYSPVRVELEEQLVEVAPHGLDRVAIALSGSSANELALRLALAATGRQDVLCFSGGYHGNDGLARTISARRPSGEVTSQAGAFRVHHTPFPDPATARRDGRALEELATSCLDRLEDQLSDPYGGLGRPGAVFVEPIQGSAGIIVPPDAFLARLREICDRYGILLVADEVQTGCGRTGAMWATDHVDARPDLITFGKGIGGGLAMAGVLGNEAIMSALPEGSHGTTFLTNALNMAAASEALQVLRDEELVERSRSLGDELLTRCQEVLGPLPGVLDVRGRGMMVGVELGTASSDASTSSDLARKVARACWDQDILLSVSGRRRNVLKLTPPLVIDRSDLLSAIDIMGQVIAELGDA